MKARRDIFWYRRDLAARVAAAVLLPLSLVYCLLVVVRKFCYRSGLCHTVHFDVPLVVVGNITAGGTGKTPILVELSRFLVSKGFRPGIVSRGYGGSAKGVHVVQQDDEVSHTGDEPLMIKQLTGLPVVVGADRVAAVERLLAVSGCDVVLSDDGLQHLRMGRTSEIVIVDASRMYGNGLCIPAGPLRETRSKLEQVDLVVYNETAMASGKGNVAFSMQPGEAVNLVSGERCALQDFIGRSVHVVAGIGNPWRLFEQLEQLGIEVTPHVFPDHHSYGMDDFSSYAGQTVLMTHKDAVKCSRLVLQHAGDHGDETGGVLQDAWYLTAHVSMSEQLESAFEKLAMALKQPDAPSKPVAHSKIGRDRD